jgi:hypothetical protein
VSPELVGKGRSKNEAEMKNDNYFVNHLERVLMPEAIE